MENISKHIAKILKGLRQERSWSLDKTAQETGVSKAMLGQIEREESSPTIATLWKIANGLQVAFSAFLEETELNANVSSLHPSDHKIRVRTLFPFDSQLNCEMFTIKLLPGCEHLSQAHKPGVIEHVIVIEGTLEVLVQATWQPLQKGEGLRFDANQHHGYRNVSAKIASFHNIIHYPMSKSSEGKTRPAPCKVQGEY